MDNIVWGIVVLISGIFVATYGSLLFRFALAFMGFALGFSLVMWLGSGLDDALRILVAIVAGGILAAVLYFLVRFVLYIAGGILGLVLMLGLLGLFQVSGMDFGGVIGWILAAAATVLGAVFGPRLGQIVLVLATSLGGAYLIVIALSALFNSVSDVGKPLSMLGTGFPLVLFLSFALVGFLGQYQAYGLRRRFLR